MTQPTSVGIVPAVLSIAAALAAINAYYAMQSASKR